MKLSEKFSLADVTRSDTATRRGFDEQFKPEQRVIDNAKEVCVNILDKIPQAFFISSFYRCKRLNRAIGGSATSDHMEGCAVDIDSQNDLNNKLIFDWIKDNCTFDQLIAEFPVNDMPSWVHVSYRKTGNRNQILVAKKINSRTVYKLYKSDKDL
jgi:zinc D-Ala-D-Ala carboxypeptidase